MELSDVCNVSNSLQSLSFEVGFVRLKFSFKLTFNRYDLMVAKLASALSFIPKE